MKRFTLGIFLLFVTIGGLIGCQEDLSSQDSSLRLVFSIDTLSFDTVFTAQGQATRTIKVYNRNNKRLSIDRVLLASAGTSGFFVNLDGRQGVQFSSVEIAPNDSLFLFASVKVDPQDQDAQIWLKDSILFYLNGNVQTVQLQAIGQDVHLLKGVVLVNDSCFTKDRPYLVKDSLIISQGATLTLSEGTTLHFHPGAYLKVIGSIQSLGSAQSWVTLRGDRLDRLFDDLAYDQMSGQWQGVQILPESKENHFQYTSIRGTSHGISVCSNPDTPNRITFENCILTLSSNNLLFTENTDVSIINSELSNSGGPLFYQLGGKSYVAHCTMANYFQFGTTNGSIVHLANKRIDQPYPLHQATFVNTIFYGSGSDIELENIKQDAVPFQHLFDHCLFKSKGEDDNNFIASQWNKNPLFLKTGKGYHYDYAIDSLSPARGTANQAISAKYPIDLRGNSRKIESGAADIGAYQWQSKIKP